MEIKITTKHILKVLYFLTWIIFIGLCIDAGGLIYSTFYSMVINTNGANDFWYHLDLLALYNFEDKYFLTETSLMIIPAVMKAIMFYLIIKILHDKKINLAQPFDHLLKRFMVNIAYLAFGIALISFLGIKNTELMVIKGVQMPDVHALKFAGADVWLFMSVTLFIVAQVFKKGIEIQEEHELTV